MRRHSRDAPTPYIGAADALVVTARQELHSGGAVVVAVPPAAQAGGAEPAPRIRWHGALATRKLDEDRMEETLDFLADYHVVQATTGTSYVTFRTLCGRVFVVGNVVHGGPFVKQAPSPLKEVFNLPLPMRVRCVSVADLGQRGAGACLAATTNGQVFAWGEDRAGWLGIGGMPAPWRPTPVRVPHFHRQGIAVRSVAIRFRSDPIGLAVTNDGKLYAWGGARTISTMNGITYETYPWGCPKKQDDMGWRGPTPQRVRDPGAKHIRLEHVTVAAAPCRILARDTRGGWHSAGIAATDREARDMQPL